MWNHVKCYIKSYWNRMNLFWKETHSRIMCRGPCTTQNSLQSKLHRFQIWLKQGHIISTWLYFCQLLLLFNRYIYCVFNWPISLWHHGLFTWIRTELNQAKYFFLWHIWHYTWTYNLSLYYIWLFGLFFIDFNMLCPCFTHDS